MQGISIAAKDEPINANSETIQQRLLLRLFLQKQ
jgi:hypothetical protein